MSWIAPEWVEYQRRRFARPDAQRTMRPDAYRWQRPDQVDENAPSYLRKFRAEETYAAESDLGAAARANAELQEQRLALARLRLDWELLKFALCGRKAGFDPDQPRVPAGNSDGGQWTSGGGGTGASIRLAGPLPPGIGHNQPPKDVPKTRPSNDKERLRAINRVARGGLLGALLAAGINWLREYEAEIEAYQDPPKTLEELQRDVFKSSTRGYQNHHVNEQGPARKEKFPEELIDHPDNLVRIPTLRHREITRWYVKPNAKFKNEQGEEISPRDYLRGRTWEERRRIGLEALIEFEVLKP